MSHTFILIIDYAFNRAIFHFFVVFKNPYLYELSMSSMRPNRREIYRYNAPWPLFAMGWSQGPAAGRDSAFRLALGMCYFAQSKLKGSLASSLWLRFTPRNL